MGAKAPISHHPSWPVVSLAEITTKIGSGATPKGGSESYLPNRTNFALVRSQNVFDRYFDHAGLAFISDEQADGLRGVVLQPNDILLNITGDGITFGRACIVPNDVLPACVNQHVSIVRLDPERADPGYVLSFLTLPEVKTYIESFNAGGSRRAITKGHIESFQLPLPPLPEQRAIAHILGTLDDKIELNRRMNETLEAMVRALFKSWFVDFDPVRAKAERRDPGLPKSLADLFPDSFEDSELGEIPKGWKVRPFTELVEVIGGGTPKTSISEYWGGDILWFSVVDAPAESGIFVIDTEKHITQKGLENSAARLLPEGTTIISARGTVGKLALVGAPMAMNQSCYGLRGIEAGAAFTYFAARNLVSMLKQCSHGSVFDTITRDTLAGVHFITPPKTVFSGFEQIVEPLMLRIKSNLTESRALAVSRDTLLPRLISGGLRVKGAGRFTERVA